MERAEADEHSCWRDYINQRVCDLVANVRFLQLQKCNRGIVVTCGVLVRGFVHSLPLARVFPTHHVGVTLDIWAKAWGGCSLES